VRSQCGPSQATNLCRVRVAYVGPYLSSSPGSAGLQRAVGVARSLATSGAEVVIGTGDYGSATPAMAQGALDSIEVTDVGVHRPSPVGRLSRGLARIRFGSDVQSWLDSLRPRVDVVIIYGGGAAFAAQILRWSQATGTPVVVDSVEWYDPSHQPLGRYGPIALDFELAMRKVYRRAGNVLAISSFLRDHFAAQGCRTIRVPPTADVLGTPWSHDVPAGPVRFAYAGTPGRKDLLDVVIRGIQSADPSGTRCTLEVVGPSPADLRELLGDGQELPRWVVVHGKLPRQQALDVVRNAHFAPLVRPDARYAHAGFPTKVVESMSVGTPVICNLTSDLRDHVRDGDTGIVSDSDTTTAFARAVTSALSMTSAERRAIRARARAEAERAFDFRRYVDPLGAFFGSVLSPSASSDH
jgi:glycosyltransferase involved in cell wall biosynthesis